MLRELALADIALRVGLRPPHRPPGPQTGVQLFAQRSTALDEQRLIDRLVRHPHLRVVWIRESQPRRDLLGRPARLELSLDYRPEPPAAGELRVFWPKRTSTSATIRDERSIPLPPAVGVHLSAHRRRRPIDPSCDRADRASSSEAAGDLLPLFEREPELRARSLARTMPAGVGDELAERRVLPAEMVGDPLHGHAGLAHLPDRRPVCFREPPHGTPP